MKRVMPPKTDEEYLWLWNVVDAAVKEALSTHPEYVAEELRPYLRLSVNKRVVGRVIGELRWNARRVSKRWPVLSRIPVMDATNDSV